MLNSAATARNRGVAYLLQRAPDCQGWDRADTQFSGPVGNFSSQCSRIDYSETYQLRCRGGVVIQADTYQVESQDKTYETMRQDPTSSSKQEVIEYLQKLERVKTIDRPLYYRLYPG